MRLSTTTLAATLFALLSSTGGAQAATSPEAISAVLADCPLEEQVGKCVNAVIDFANGLPGSADRNGDLMTLVGALAAEAMGNRTTPLICQELELSIRMAGQAAVGASSSRTITTITARRLALRRKRPRRRRRSKKSRSSYCPRNRSSRTADLSSRRRSSGSAAVAVLLQRCWKIFPPISGNQRRTASFAPPS